MGSIPCCRNPDFRSGAGKSRSGGLAASGGGVDAGVDVGADAVVDEG